MKSQEVRCFSFVLINENICAKIIMQICRAVFVNATWRV